jgi:hypothetical protein
VIQVAFGAVNCEFSNNEQLCRQFNIHSFPTIIFLSQDERFSKVYLNQGHEAEQLIEFARGFTENKVLSLTPATFETLVPQVNLQLLRLHLIA